MGMKGRRKNRPPKSSVLHDAMRCEDRACVSVRACCNLNDAKHALCNCFAGSLGSCRAERRGELRRGADSESPAHQPEHHVFCWLHSGATSSGTQDLHVSWGSKLNSQRCCVDRFGVLGPHPRAGTAAHPAARPQAFCAFGLGGVWGILM